MKLFVFIFSLLIPAMGLAQNYTIDWHKVAGGGGTSTGATYQVSGTVGQPDAGSQMSGGNYSLTGGFWSITAVQTPGAPLLTVASAGGNAIVSWPSPSTGFVLQQNPSVDNAGGWVNYGGPVSSNAVTLSVTVTPAAGSLFFRLKHP